jgi:hypothetical protein
MPIRQRTFEQRHERESAARRRVYHLNDATCDAEYSPLSDIAAGAMHGLLSMGRGAYEMARRAAEGEEE